MKNITLEFNGVDVEIPTLIRTRFTIGKTGIELYLESDLNNSNDKSVCLQRIISLLDSSGYLNIKLPNGTSLYTFKDLNDLIYTYKVEYIEDKLIEFVDILLLIGENE